MREALRESLEAGQLSGNARSATGLSENIQPARVPSTATGGHIISGSGAKMVSCALDGTCMEAPLTGDTPAGRCSMLLPTKHGIYVK